MSTDAAFDGARQIIEQCLGLTPGQDLVVFLDETTLPAATLIITAAASLAVAVTPIFVPTALQRRIPAGTALSLPIASATREARAIITCVSAEPDCLPFRDHILENERSARTRIGHMPGATPEVLTMANVDFAALVADCARLEQVMLRGSQLELLSYASGGESHRLRAAIGGWEQLAIASDGVIRDGAWGNVPSGETYIAPLPGSAEGSVVINGSIPGLVIAQGEEIVLRFAGGRLVAIEPETRPAARWLRTTQIDVARAQGDENWDNLAEIGVGVNPAVTRLTGTMLFDEKAAGTVHVALGSNTQMGGRIESKIHCDMVITGPSLEVDGKPVIRRGALCVADEDWLEDFAAVPLADSPLREQSELARTGVDAELGDGHLRRVFRSETGRVARAQVGTPETARLAAALYAQLPANAYSIPLGRLVAQARLSRETARRVLHVMQRYGLVQVVRA